MVPVDHCTLLLAEQEMTERAAHLLPFRCTDRKTGKTKNGFANSRLEMIYTNMIERCHKPGAIGYERYGRKGIHVCPEWRASRLLFYLWSLLNGYREDLSLDRRNNDFGDSPSNCRWVTEDVQRNNRTNSALLTYNGVTKSLSQWGRETGISRSTIGNRVRYGWPAWKVLGFGMPEVGVIAPVKVPAAKAS
jgi:hypothetical protein